MLHLLIKKLKAHWQKTKKKKVKIKTFHVNAVISILFIKEAWKKYHGPVSIKRFHTLIRRNVSWAPNQNNILDDIIEYWVMDAKHSALPSQEFNDILND